MRFQATHKLMSYLLVATALATLASSDALGLQPALLLLVFGGLSWFFDAGGAPARLADRAASLSRVLVLATFVLAAWGVWRHLPEPDLGPVLNLVMFLLGYKLFYRRV